MIALLRGRLAASSLGELVVDVAGVGYRVRIAPGAAFGAVGAEVTVHTHLAVREDALTLYGFADPTARAVFETLLGVTGVGPKVGLAALGTLGVDGLRRAVLGEDVDALTVVPGVGRKGAQRMILELRGRLGSSDADGLPGAGGPTAGDGRAEAAEALAALGYAAGEVRGALEGLPDRPGADAEQLLREALRALGSR